MSKLVLKDIINSSIFTGLRTEELIALEWKDIDYEHKEIRVSKTHNRGKTGTPKTKSPTRNVDILLIVEKYARYIREDKINRAKFLEKWHIFGTSENPTRLKARKEGKY